MSVLIVSGTGTGIGKTIVVAAIAALAAAEGKRVALVKPAQTGLEPGEPGDLDVAARLSGVADLHELSRYPEPLAPATAGRRSGLPDVPWVEVVDTVEALSLDRDLVLVEGAGGLLVRLDRRGGTVADVAAAIDAPVLVVVPAGLGALNACALTAEALRARDATCAGVVIGSWPREPDLAAWCNVGDLEDYAGAPLVGALPEQVGALDADQFRRVAHRSLGPQLGGHWNAGAFRDAAARAVG